MGKVLKVAVISPYCHIARGNAISVQRLVSGLTEEGLEVKLICLDDHETPALLYQAVEEFSPDLIHALHAYRSGEVGLALVQRLQVPLVTSLRGTDVNHDLLAEGRRQVVVEMLRASARIVVFAAFSRETLSRELPEVVERVRVIPHAVRMEPLAHDWSSELGLGPEDFVFLFPAGIRWVKQVCWPMAPLGRLRDRHPRLRLLYAGPILEEETGKQFLQQLAAHPWITYLGPVPHNLMHSLYLLSQVTLNCSVSEGMPNALLEAMSLGKVVLAARIDGNKAVVEDGVDGLLYGEEEEFQKKGERLLTDPVWRQQLGERARAKAERYHGARQEVNTHLALYSEVLGEAATHPSVAAP